MIELVDDMDYVYMILIAAGVGAIGGLGAELLLQRSDSTGTIELPGRVKGTRLVDIGFPASIILGAIAAVAVLYFFPPVVERIDEATKKTVTEFDLVKLVALSVIVGSAGPAFLSTTQSRVMSALNAQRADAAVETGKAQVQQVAESAKVAVKSAVQDALAEHMPTTGADDIKAMVDTATTSLVDELQSSVNSAQDQIATITETPASFTATTT